MSVIRCHTGSFLWPKRPLCSACLPTPTSTDLLTGSVVLPVPPHPAPGTPLGARNFLSGPERGCAARLGGAREGRLHPGPCLTTLFPPPRQASPSPWVWWREEIGEDEQFLEEMIVPNLLLIFLILPAPDSN